MLILFFGVSGVGKTTLIDELVSNFGWRYVPTYMTRAMRGREAAKISITKEQFYEMECDGKFLCINSFFGNLYGTPLRQVQSAVEAQHIYWVMDFPLVKRELVFSNYPHIGFIIFPEDIAQLEEQVLESGREGRLTAILEDYHENHLRNRENRAQLFPTFSVINYRGKVHEVAEQIKALAVGVHHGRFD